MFRNNGQIKSAGITIDELKEEFTSKRIQDNKKPVPSNVVRTYTELLGYFEKLINVVFSSDQQKELWDILVERPHHIGGSEASDDSNSGTFGDQMSSNSHRRQSPFHPDPTNTTIEEQLKGSHHDTLNHPVVNMQSQSAQQGKAVQTGIGQPAAFASGKGAALFMGDLPANQTLI